MIFNGFLEEPENREGVMLFPPGGVGREKLTNVTLNE